MTTNANSDLTATVLSAAKLGTFTGLVTTKKGEKRGGVICDNDKVHVVIYTGFKYEGLVERSLIALEGLSDQDILDEANSKGLVDGKGSPLTLADVEEARAELKASFRRTLDSQMESTSTTSHVYDGLTVCNEKVRGGRVYKCQGTEKCRCRACTGDSRAPLDGTIYLQGLKIWEQVIEPAENRKPPVKSKAKVVAKNLLKSKLPVSRYVSYALEPGGEWILRAGGTAQIEATVKGFVMNEDLWAVLKKAVG